MLSSYTNVRFPTDARRLLSRVGFPKADRPFTPNCRRTQIRAGYHSIIGECRNEP
jgi:hypothetical protein